jgi:electron transfer flavoprotein alpha subunit
VKQRAQLHLRLQHLSDSMHFLEDAADQVISCRRVLMYTYVMAFYSADHSNKQLFERHQEMLEESTERLHGFLESKDLTLLDRAQVINTTDCVERFRKSLLADINDDDNMVVDAKPIQKDGAVQKKVDDLAASASASSASSKAAVP